jgi:hypothetical protein
MRLLGGGLMCASPEGPGDDVGRIDPFSREAMCYAPDLLDRPADEPERLVFLGVGLFVWCRMAAIMAKASMTNET